MECALDAMKYIVNISGLQAHTSGDVTPPNTVPKKVEAYPQPLINDGHRWGRTPRVLRVACYLSALQVSSGNLRSCSVCGSPSGALTA